MSYKNLTKKELLEMIDDLEREVADLESEAGFNDEYDCKECDSFSDDILDLRKQNDDLEDKVEELEDEIVKLENDLDTKENLNEELTNISSDLCDIQSRIDNL